MDVDIPDSALATDLPASPPAAPSWPAGIPIPPQAKDVGLLRNSWQFTPADINGYVDRHRPTLLAAGFSNEDIDQYYGVESFDVKAAAQKLVGHAQAADDGGQVPEEGPFGRVTRNPDFLNSAADSPDLMTAAFAAQTTPETAGAARDLLVQSYRTGACNTSDGFR